MFTNLFFNICTYLLYMYEKIHIQLLIKLSLATSSLTKYIDGFVIRLKVISKMIKIK